MQFKCSFLTHDSLKSSWETRTNSGIVVLDKGWRRLENNSVIQRKARESRLELKTEIILYFVRTVQTIANSHIVFK